MYTIALSANPLSIDGVGTKAASLATLLTHGIMVPPGFVVTTAAHRRFLEANAVPNGGCDVDKTVWPAELADEIEMHLAHYPPSTRWAVRSSGTVEDLAEASFAGQYDTFLDVPRDKVLSRIRDCWASLSSPHAASYAQERGLSLQDTLMGVIVQTLVAADVAGVSFSRHPVTGDDSVVINAAYGLGEAVVSGVVTPDSFEVNKATKGIVSYLGFKESQIRLAKAGGTELIETPPEQQDVYCIGPDQVLEISAITERLETLVGYPVDVEWALQAGTLYCLQMRPITLAIPGGNRS